MWRFSVPESKWEAVSALGYIPSPRENFYSVQYFDLGILIFGGKSDEVHSEVYFFSFYSKSWNNPTYTGDIPGPRHSGCALTWGLLFVMIGGYSEGGITDEIWILDPLNFISYKVTWQGSTKVKLMNHGCRSLEFSDKSVQVYLFGGEDIELGQSDYSYIIKIWEEDKSYYSVLVKTIQITDTSMKVGDSRSVFFDNTSLIFFGSSWALYFSNSIVKIDHSTEKYDIIKVPFYGAGHSLVNYNRSIYIFGGCSSKNIIFFKNCFSNNLYKLDFEDSDNIQLPCGLGMIPPGCEFCPTGTYLSPENKCIPCGPGKYSKMRGAVSTLSCIPCDYGTFNKDDISSDCKDCPGGSTCYIGSSEPNYNIQYIGDSSTQPKKFSSGYNSISWYTAVAAIVLSCLIVLLFLMFHKFRGLAYKMDSFTSQHSNDLDQPIIYRKTAIGGLFSLFFLAFCLATVPPMMDSYINDNIYEQKALVPLVTVDKTISSSFLVVIIDLHYYGGKCVEGDACISLLLVTDENINYRSRSFSCTKLPDACSIQISYTDCEIIGLAWILIESYEFDSYCSILSVNVTSDSSIPSEVSSVQQYLKPKSRFRVFKGMVESEFSFEMIPSVFYSESGEWSSELTGYHVSKYGSSVIGGTSEQK